MQNNLSQHTSTLPNTLDLITPTTSRNDSDIAAIPNTDYIPTPINKKNLEVFNPLIPKQAPMGTTPLSALSTSEVSNKSFVPGSVAASTTPVNMVTESQAIFNSTNYKNSGVWKDFGYVVGRDNLGL